MANDLVIIEHTTMPPAVKEGVERVLLAIAAGQTVSEGGMTEAQFAGVLLRYPEVRTALVESRKVGGLMLEQRAMAAVGDLYHERKKATTNEIAVVRLFADQLKWSAERSAPEIYQARQQNIVVPVQIVTTLDMGSGSGTKEHPDIYDLKAENVVPVEEPPEILEPGEMEARHALRERLRQHARELRRKRARRPSQPRKRVLNAPGSPAQDSIPT